MRNGIVSPQAIDMGIASIKLESSPAIIIKYIHYGNRQGALADGLHGLNPRITAHRYTPVQKATSVDLATGKTQRTSVVIKALWISEQIRHAHLGLFVYLIHLKAWRGKEEMALSTLGELWSKGN